MRNGTSMQTICDIWKGTANVRSPERNEPIMRARKVEVLAAHGPFPYRLIRWDECGCEHVIECRSKYMLSKLIVKWLAEGSQQLQSDPEGKNA